jgi:hypothetical protein
VLKRSKHSGKASIESSAFQRLASDSVLAVIGALAVVSAACGTTDQPLPAKPIAEVSSHDCTVASGGATGPHLTVDPDPRGVTAVWIPGLEEACHPVVTHGNQQMASALADDIRNAPNSPLGIFNCPLDTGQRVRLYFAYGSHQPGERADISLSGCEGITAPGRSGRTATAALGRDLLAIAPPFWRKDLAP